MVASIEFGAWVAGTMAVSVLLLHCGSRSQLNDPFETIEVAARGGASSGSETLNRAGRAGAGGMAKGGASAAGGEPSTGGNPAKGGSPSGGGIGRGGSSGGGASPRCAPDGQYRCLGHAQIGRELCIRGIPEARPCTQDSLCDSATGSCLPIVSKCSGHLPGYSYCDGKNVMVCGPDLVSTTMSASCPVGCAMSATGAVCTVTKCGDGIRQLTEQCDDGNTQDGDACPADCHIDVVSIASGADHVCAVAKNGILKCWGDNLYCQLGIGATGNRGNQTNQMGEFLPAVNLGPGAVPKAVAAGPMFTCALTSSGQVKCWGIGREGELGNGDSYAVGCLPQDMGLALASVQLGTGELAVALIAGDQHSCALSGEGRVKCWGLDNHGAAGLGDFPDLTNTVDSPDQSGDAWPFVPLSTAPLKVKALGGGIDRSCAIFTDGRLKCWGSNALGALGLGLPDSGTTDALGDGRGEMGDALPFVSLPQGTTPVTVVGGIDDTCALLDNGTVVCWGQGVGDAPSEMGDHLVPVPLGTGRTAKFLAKGRNHQCVILENGHVKCWGRSKFALGLGDNRARTAPGDLGDRLVEVDLGTGRTALSLSLGDATSCALLDNHTVKCWGVNNGGVLGQGYSVVLGDDPGEMGDALPIIDLAF